ncbi:MAG: hypothetical protein METHAR1v1_760006 [Methanothrix sp.]|jgi:hypothetical protein|nr:MAG: hypothetical protein METHAR1v1_760006 [Methanothrix sp.]
MPERPSIGSSIKRPILRAKAYFTSTKFSEEPLILGAALMVMLFFILYAFSGDETGGEVWSIAFGGPGFEVGTSIIEKTDGGYIIAGATNSWGRGGYDAWLLSTDPKGIEIWNETHGGPGDEEAMAVVATVDGGYAITGGTNSFGAGDFDIWLIKTDSTGVEEWNRTYGGPGYDWAYSIEKAKDGGYLILGETTSLGAGGMDLWLIKTDSLGAPVWNRTFGGGEDDGGRSIQETDDGGYIITGFSESFGRGGMDLWLLKVDSDGNEEWNRTFGGSKDDMGQSVRQTKDGGYVLAGGANSPSTATPPTGDAWLIRTDRSGTPIWGRIYSFGDASYDLATTVRETDDGGFIVAGRSSEGKSSAWLIKTDDAGMKEWEVVYKESGREEGSSVLVAGDGSYVTTGWTTSAGSPDLWLAKIR